MTMVPFISGPLEKVSKNLVKRLGKLDIIVRIEAIQITFLLKCPNTQKSSGDLWKVEVTQISVKKKKKRLTLVLKHRIA